MAQVDLVAVVGPSGVGKTTIVRKAVAREPELHMVLNNTSRERRPDEHDGVEYRFRSHSWMMRRIERREYVQVAPSVFGDLYATAAEDYATEGVALLPVLAEALPQFHALPFRSVRAIYVVPPGWSSWERRLGGRRTDADRFVRRMAEARRSLEFAGRVNDIMFVVNEDLLRAAADLATLALKRQPSSRLVNDQWRARAIVHELLYTLRQADEPRPAGSE